MKIVIWSDYVCPFCYIGQAHLNKALADFEHAEKVEIEYKSFILSPDTQYEPDKDYYQIFSESKGYSVDETKTIFGRIERMANRAGISMDFDSAKNTNTSDAHRVMQYAKELGKDAEFFKRFYKAHFTEGINIGDRQEIIRLSGEIGLDGDKVKQILENNEYSENVYQDVLESRSIGVSTIPLFIFNGNHSISGAQPVKQFVNALNFVWEEEHAASK